MIRFARAAKCGNFAASGFSPAAVAGDSLANMEAKASEPKPTAERCKSARRDITAGELVEGISGFRELEPTERP